MDPSAELCRIGNNRQHDQLPTPSGFSIDVAKMLHPAIKITNSDSLPPVYVNQSEYARLQQVKALYKNSAYNNARKKANPFERLGKSIFMDRAGVKLANIDAVFGISGHIGGFLAKQTLGQFTFCDLAGAPGAWSQYLQFRRPEAFGYGISLRDENMDWNVDKLDMDRFNIYYGEDGSGNLYTQADSFTSYVRSTEVEGVDLVVADGGFGVEGRELDQEFLTSRLILSEMYTALSVLRAGASFVCKVYDTVTTLMAECLYLMACAFDEIVLFKPVSSRPANSEKYLICQGRRQNIEAIISILRLAYNSYEDGRVYALIDNVPDKFTRWLKDMNDLFCRHQLQVGGVILNIISGRKMFLPQYNLHKCLTIWNLPDNYDDREKRRYQGPNKYRYELRQSPGTVYSTSNL